MLDLVGETERESEETKKRVGEEKGAEMEKEFDSGSRRRSGTLATAAAAVER